MILIIDLAVQRTATYSRTHTHARARGHNASLVSAK
jgi:hypothetical protein